MNTVGGARVPNVGSRIRLAAVAMCAAVVAAAVAACSSSDDGNHVTLLTHDSFSLPDDVRAEFTTQTGASITVAQQGDAGQLASTVALTPGRPKADVVYGIDNTFASRAVTSGALEPYAAPALRNGPAQYALPGSRNELTPIDRGDVCVNVDTAWFAARRIPAPTSIDQLTDPRYRDDFVALDPATSSPGLGFLLATIAAYPATWRDYWSGLRRNGVSVVSGWETAYNQDFSGGQGKGDKPIVVSYASSPAANPATKALLDGCFRQVEYAGVLKGTAKPDLARKLVDFLLSDRVQRALPDAMYVYPVVDEIPLPPSWAANAPLPESTIELSPSAVARNRETWQQQWRQTMGR